MKKTQGIAFVTILILLVVSVSLVSLTTFFALSNRTSSTDNLLTIQAQYAAEAGIDSVLDLAVYGAQRNLEILRQNGLQNVSLDGCTLKLLLTGVVGVDSSVAVPNDNLNGVPTCQYGWNTLLAQKTSSTKLVNPPMPNLYDGVTLTSTQLSTLKGTVGAAEFDVTIRRVDDVATGSIRLDFESTGQTKNGTAILATRKLKKSVAIAGEPYPGDRFAMLTTATNCSFCHLYIDTMERAYDDTPNVAYDRALVGILNSDNDKVNFCGEWHRDSVIAGTLYLRQSDFSNSNNCGSFEGADDRLLSFKWFDATTNAGKVRTGPIATAKGNWFGDEGSGSTDIADAGEINAASATGAATKYGKIYYNYPTTATVAAAPWNKNFPDAALPADFPAVIKDLDANSMVDDTEWATFVAQRPGGSSLTGGLVRGFKRPNAAAAMNTMPSSYDPIALNAYSTTLAGKNSDPVLARRQLMIDLDLLRGSGYSAAQSALFVTNWRGWLLQQALATPNNRDHFPTNPTFYSSVAGGYQTRAYVEAIAPALTNLTNATAAARTLNLRLPMQVVGSNNAGIVRVEFFNPANAALPTGVPFAVQWLQSSANRSMATIADLTTVGVEIGGIAAGGLAIPADTVVRIYPRRFQAISWGDQSRAGIAPNATTFFGADANGTGALENNFHLNYAPSLGQLSLTFCTDTTANCPNRATLTIPNVDDSLLFPQSSDTTTQTALGNGLFDGNLVVDGGRIDDTTNTSVMTIQGTVLVNGDVVIRGRIEGRGRLVARGNIYVVGDLIYWCGMVRPTVTGSLCSRSEYQTLTSLPQVALMAGGGIFAGDFDISDGNSRSSNLFGNGLFSNQLDLINDQTLQRRSPESGIGGRISPSYYNLPGGTGGQAGGTGRPALVPSGDNDTGNAAGFLNEILPPMNQRSNVRKFLYSPFGLIANATGRAARYEDSSTTFFLNGGTRALNGASVIPLGPTNGPIGLGSNSNAGFSSSPGTGQLSAGLSCSTSNFNTDQDPAVPSVFAGATGLNNADDWRSSFNFSFWCPPSAPTLATGFYLRADRINNTIGNTPANDAAAWMLQPTQNAALDGNAGMTTGWLGGLVGLNTTTNVYSQLGDLSQTRLLKLMWMATIQGGQSLTPPIPRAAKPFRTDGVLYSPQAVFGFVRSRTSGGDGSIETPTQTQGRWIHNGSLISYELGFLSPGLYGDNQSRYTTETSVKVDFVANTLPFDITDKKRSDVGGGMTILYDRRMAGFLNIDVGAEVKIKPLGGYAQIAR
jgi:hypothetical protein